MKDFELADNFRQIFAADGTNFPALDSAVTPPTGIAVETQQSQADFARPVIIFEARAKALDAIGRVLAYTLSVTVESDNRITGYTAAMHAAWVAAVQAKFFGETAAGLTAAKAAITNAMANLGVFTLRNYDSPPDNDGAPAVDPHLWRNVVSIAGIALLTGNV